MRDAIPSDLDDQPPVSPYAARTRTMLNQFVRKEFCRAGSSVRTYDAPTFGNICQRSSSPNADVIGRATAACLEDPAFDGVLVLLTRPGQPGPRADLHRLSLVRAACDAGLPAGVDDEGLPLGVQLMGVPLGDDDLLALAARQPLGIITKNALVVRDLDLLKDMAARRLVHVNLSITTLDRAPTRTRSGETPVPYLRLSGQWLEQHGFTRGSRVTITAENGKLVLTIAHPPPCT